MVNLQAVLDGFGVVVGASGLLAAFEHTAHELLFWYLEADDMVDFLTALGQKAVEGFGLGDCAGEAVEDYAVLGLGFVVDNLLEDANHQRIGNQLPLVDVGFGNLSYGSLAVDMVAEHLTCRDVVQTVFVDEFFALGAFAAAGGTENYNIHFYTLKLITGERPRAHFLLDCGEPGRRSHSPIT